MSQTFNQGYALLIGVNQQSDPQLANYQLPGVAKDIIELEKVIRHPERCAYPKENVRILLGKDATKQNILDGLDWLENQIHLDPLDNATALIYFSGHGFVTPDQQEKFYLIPYDANTSSPAKLFRTAIQDHEWAQEIAEITAKRMLLILDCCHAGSTLAKDSSKEKKRSKEETEEDPDGPAPRTVDSKPLPIQLGTRWEGFQLSNGRAVLRSSRSSEKSYMRPGNDMSLFTYHLIEALTGHANHRPGDTEVYILDVMNYLTQQVPESAREIGKEQHPNFHFEGESFPISKLLGGKGIPRGKKPPTVEETITLPVESNSPIVETNTSSINGDGNIVIQGINDSRVNVNSEINKVSNSPNAIVGSKMKAGGDIFVGGSKTTSYHDQRSYDQSSHDRSFSFGNVGSMRGVNFGDNSKVDYTENDIQGSELEELEKGFKEVYTKIEELEESPDKLFNKSELKEEAQELEAELKKGEKASSRKIKRLLTSFKLYAPSILETIAKIIENPKIIISQSIRGIASLIKVKDQ